MIGFNFRGVGGSTGWPVEATDLSIDGHAMIKFLTDQGVNERDITLHGHSLGGAVAVDVARTHPSVKVISDRSFSYVPLDGGRFHYDRIGCAGRFLSRLL